MPKDSRRAERAMEEELTDKNVNTGQPEENGSGCGECVAHGAPLSPDGSAKPSAAPLSPDGSAEPSAAPLLPDGGTGPSTVQLPSSAALAYLGDARHSLFIRDMLVRRGISHAKELNALALSYITAPAQAEATERIMPHLTEEERAVYRRAVNTPHINRPKNVSGAQYRAATGFEAVIGMLTFRGDEERATELLRMSCAAAEDKRRR